MNNLYAIGDIHGDYDILCHLLRENHITDEDLNWISGDATLVFIGDLTDRGPKGIEVINFVMNLQKQAQNRGGDVISLCGNHDALITAMALQLKFNGWIYGLEDLFHQNDGSFFEARKLSNDETMLEWMQLRPLMYQQDEILFQHADTCAFYDSLGDDVENVNKQGLEMLKTSKGAYKIFCDMTDCRFWDQSSSSSEDETENNILEYMYKHNVNKIIHGHTRFTGDRPEIYFDGKLINIDGTMSSGYRNGPNRGFIYDCKIYN